MYNLPRLRAPAVRTQIIEITRTLEHDDALGMTLTLDGESLVNVLVLLEERKEPSP